MSTLSRSGLGLRFWVSNTRDNRTTAARQAAQRHYSREPRPPGSARLSGSIDRIRQALNRAVETQSLPEIKFSMADQWQRRLFLALCRRYGLEPYRYKGQRYNTLVIRAPRDFVKQALWPEYLELQAALHSYLHGDRTHHSGGVTGDAADQRTDRITATGGRSRRTTSTRGPHCGRDDGNDVLPAWQKQQGRLWDSGSAAPSISTDCGARSRIARRSRGHS